LLSRTNIVAGLTSFWGAGQLRGELASGVQIAYLAELLCPQVKDISLSPKKSSISQPRQITRKHKNKSLRELAEEYGVSHEMVTRTIRLPRYKRLGRPEKTARFGNEGR